MDTNGNVDINKLTKAELKELLVERGLATSGNKDTLVKRLMESRQEADEEDYLSVQEEQQSNNNVHDDVAPEDSASNVGSSSSVRSRRALNAAKLQSLQVKKAAMVKEQELKRKKVELEAELERVKLEAEIEAMEAEENVFDEVDARRSPPKLTKGYEPPVDLDTFLNAAAKGLNKEAKDGLRDDTTMLQQRSTTNKAAPITATQQTTPTNQAAQVEQVQSSAMHIQQQMLDLMTLPKPQLISFDGDPLNFYMFLNMFDSCVHNSNINDSAKLNRLFELCKDKALRLIKPCALMPPSDGYRRARELLTERFGAIVRLRSTIRLVKRSPGISGVTQRYAKHTV